jgi:hypothetical protein
MYKAYEAKNDSPAIRALLYLSLCKGLVFAAVLIVLDSALRSQGLNLRSSPATTRILVYALWVVILIYNYFEYSRRGFAYFESKFSGYDDSNNKISVWMLIVLPFGLLFLGISLSIFLFGGTAFGNQITGVLQ